MKKSERTFAQRAIHSLQVSRNSLTEADVLKNSRTSTNWINQENHDNHLTSDMSSTLQTAGHVSWKVVIFYVEIRFIFIWLGTALDDSLDNPVLLWSIAVLIVGSVKPCTLSGPCTLNWLKIMCDCQKSCETLIPEFSHVSFIEDPEYPMINVFL